jgi:signal peptidase II
MCKEAGQAKTMNPAAKSYRWLFWSLAIIGLVADQTSKYVVFRQLYEGPLDKGEVNIIPGAFKLLAQYSGDRDTSEGLLHFLRTVSSDMLPQVNRGALFGIGSASGLDANLIFAAVSVLAAVAIIYWSVRPNARGECFLCLSLGLILAGTLGNLYDRVVFGGVRDFLYWYYLVDWPVFNVADCCLVCGAGMLLLQAFVAEKRPPAQDTLVAEEAATDQSPYCATRDVMA